MNDAIYRNRYVCEKLHDSGLVLEALIPHVSLDMGRTNTNARLSAWSLSLYAWIQIFQHASHVEKSRPTYI